MLDLLDDPNPPPLDQERLTFILARGRKHLQHRRNRRVALAAGTLLAIAGTAVIAADSENPAAVVTSAVECHPNRPPHRGERRVDDGLSFGVLPSPFVGAPPQVQRNGFSLQVIHRITGGSGPPLLAASVGPDGVPRQRPDAGTTSTVDINGHQATLLLHDPQLLDTISVSWSDGDRLFAVSGVSLPAEIVLEAARGLRYERGRAAPATGDLGQVLTRDQAIQSTSVAAELPLRRTWLVLPEEYPNLFQGTSGNRPLDEPVWVILRAADPGTNAEAANGAVNWGATFVGATTGHQVGHATGSANLPPELASLPDHSMAPPCPLPSIPDR